MTKHPSTAPPLAHQLAVVGLGAYTGVMIAIGLGLGRYWLSLSPSAFVEWFTPNFWFLLPTVGVTLPVALWGSLWSWKLASAAGPTAKRQWRTVVLLLLVTVVVTMAYHLPANFRIWSGTLDDAQVERELGLWLAAHLLRVGPALVATVLAFRAAFQIGPPAAQPPVA